MPYPYDLGYPPPDAPVNIYVEPEVLAAGDTLSFRRNLSLHRPQDGWALSYALALELGGAPITFDATVDATDFVVNVPGATTIAWKAGRYTIQGYATNAGTSSRNTIYEGFLTVLPNLATTLATVDLRSHARRTLDMIEATIEGRAGNDILDSKIDNTEFRRLTPDQLLKLHSYYAAKVRGEEAQTRIKAGRANGRTILGRFTQPRP